jgi:hypothetical protein
MGLGLFGFKYQDPMASIPRKRSDSDNLSKFVLDALNGVLQGDDSPVTWLQAITLYDYTYTGKYHGCTGVQAWRLRKEDFPTFMKRPPL